VQNLAVVSVCTCTQKQQPNFARCTRS